MKIEQTRWTEAKGWYPEPPGKNGLTAQLVLLFGSRDILSNEKIVAKVRAAYPKAHFAGCSTGGEICGSSVSDHSLVVTALEFKQTCTHVVATPIKGAEDSYQAGERLAQLLSHASLIHVLVLTEGIFLNGGELVKGLTKHLPGSVSVTGGLAGDGTAFKETLVLWNDQTAKEAVVAVGFYGTHLKIGYGSLGGWDPFGPERRVTRSRGNVLYELDGKSALELYKHYLGEEDAKGLPSTGVLFPLSVRSNLHDTAVVRTVWSINEAEQSMTFTGDLPDGGYARLMKANFDRLIDGAMGAARTSCDALAPEPPDLAILISCVGRKMVLKQRTEEEVEGVRKVMGKSTVLTGFYSNGEISPFRALSQVRAPQSNHDDHDFSRRVEGKSPLGPEMNNLLQRQLRKYYGDVASIPPEWNAFIDAIDKAYDEFDDDRRKLERSIDISSDELGKANSQLNDRACQLEAANKELEAFSYSVSHDLRAPLRHIAGFVDLLAKHAAGKLDERENYYLNIIADSAHQMGTLIDDLLTFSRMNRTEMQHVRFSTESLVHDAVKGASQLQPKERRIVWKIGSLPDVEADPAMMRQVWVNLIGNAIKYSRTHEPSVIEIGGDDTANDEVIFFIRDNGVGFDMQYANKLFGVFQRLHRTEEFEGTGIGLAHVRRIISRQGGRTWAEGKKNEGATFYFSLPKAPQESKG